MGVDLANLYQRMRPALHRRAERILRDAALAEDVVQEAFVLGGTLGALSMAATEAEAAALLWHRCVGRCLTVLRTARRRAHHEGSAAIVWRQSRGKGGAARAEARLDCCRVYLEALVEMAPERDARIVFLVTVCGMTPSEVAASESGAGLTPQRIGQIDRHWRARLADRFPELAEDEGGDDDADA